jgi:hypothetical protein
LFGFEPAGIAAGAFLFISASAPPGMESEVDVKDRDIGEDWDMHRASR